MVYYEVGTEEISGGMTEPDSFERFIRLLKRQLTDHGYEQTVGRLLFIVGQVGTTMRIDMANHFNPQQAKALVDIASQHDLFLKVHNTDWLETPVLEQFPDLGTGAANVGPEFAAAIMKALGKLEKKEVQALQEADKNPPPSKIMESIEGAVREAPWQKFAPKDLGDRELGEFAQAHQREIALCVGRYVMNKSGSG